MAGQHHEAQQPEIGAHPEDLRILPGVLAVIGLGIALGVGYNWLGLESRRSWGVAWIGSDPLVEIAKQQTITAPSPNDGYNTEINDPQAIFGSTASQLPEIPAAGRPIPIDMAATQLYVEAQGALLIDARAEDEFAEGHIAGSINVPYETAATDPVLLESLDSRGRPIIVYCGGGSCEVSIKLAEELLFAGHQRIAVYMGGFPEWQEAGLPVSVGEPAGDS